MALLSFFCLLQIGELLDGQICVKNLSTHAARSKDEFLALIALAKAARTTAATERNAASSRSHGVGMVRVSYLQVITHIYPALVHPIDSTKKNNLDQSTNTSPYPTMQVDAISPSFLLLLLRSHPPLPLFLIFTSFLQDDGSLSTAGLCPGMLYIIDLAGSERMADRYDIRP